MPEAEDRATTVVMVATESEMVATLTTAGQSRTTRGEVVEVTKDKAKDEAKTVEIFVNNKEVTVPKKTTGAEIKQEAGVDLAFQLFRVEGKTEHEVGDDEEIHVHEGQRFVATPTLDPS